MPTDPIAPVWAATLTSLAIAVAPVAAMGLGSVVAVRASRRSSLAPVWSLGLGALAGILLAAAAIAGGPLAVVLGPSDILAAGSPWGISGEALVGERFPAALAGLGTVLNAPLSALPGSVAWLIRAAIMIVAAAIALALFTLPPLRALTASAATIAVAGLSAVAALYIVCFGPWLLNLLNFWALGLLLALFCYWRHGTL